MSDCQLKALRVKLVEALECKDDPWEGQMGAYYAKANQEGYETGLHIAIYNLDEILRQKNDEK